MVVIVMVCSRLTHLSGEEDYRTMYKVGGVAGVSGALGMLSASFLAGSSDDKPSTALSVDELSLYTTPQERFRYVEPERGQVEERVATLRKLAEPYTALCQQTAGSARQKVQGVYGAVKLRLDSTVQFGQNNYAYLKNPPPEFYPRAGVIGFAGIIGLFLGRGSRLKKLVYPSGLMAVAASLYYPKEAVTMAKGTGDTMYDWALQAFVAVENLLKDKPRVQQKAGLAEKNSSGDTKA
ncbi:apolipoprotein O, a isoform X1 [Triplophysa dalaica]|uniref:apolipoprotein O, a isoform X1 n=1 Tax=Triplophysa dalaica TaxID=1582913 RepID=UPI0024E0402D|nr:apolipoprotein O, a isoform X1 [Triplophysa dalaica]